MNSSTGFKCGYVTIIGRPNVGKSTLLNKLLGQKLSITSSKPQTTRWHLLGINTTKDYQIIYIDTPGLQSRYNSAINRHMRREFINSLSHVDVLVFVVEELKWTEDDEHVLRLIENVMCPVVLVINKSDRVSQKEALLPYMEKISGKKEFREIIPVSALKADNTDRLEKIIVSLLPESEQEFPDDQVTDRNERFFAAEFIREKVTRILGQELPYKISVTIEEFSDKGNILHVSANIWVETESQKKIVIGKNGHNLKIVGENARKDMEQLFNKKVYLQNWVRVKKKWSEDEKALKQFGFEQ